MGLENLVSTVFPNVSFEAINCQINSVFNNLFYIRHALGKDGEIVNIPKFRTMVFDADELLFDEIEKNGIGSYGKPDNDSRVTPIGKILRKYWIDELPQLYSLIRGDLSLVGIRPGGKNDWKLFPDELKERTLKFKPGFLGVLYASEKPLIFSQIIDFYNDYLDQREINPIQTQLKYGTKIIYNILIKGARGK